MTRHYYAHSIQNPDGSPRPAEEWEPLFTGDGQGHLEKVAALAAEFASKFGAREWGYLAGLWHDLGKYQEAFQAKLRGDSVQIEHAGAGAMLAAIRSPQTGIPLAYSIAGHHAGLANQKANAPEFGPVARLPLTDRLKANQAVVEEIQPVVVDRILEAGMPELPTWLFQGGATKESGLWSLEFFTRVLFSSLVDADRLATEGFYAAAEKRPASQSQLEYDSLSILQQRLDAYIDQKCRGTNDDATPINELRASILQSCRQAARRSAGIFSLTVPTGGGKTLSAMSFALNHAINNDLDRVIVVIPYTSIIRQNATVYREAFGTKEGILDQVNVVEHHSGVDEQQAMEQNSVAEIRRRIAAENWDAPIIVTTSVQFFESLLSDHPSQCRKLHRIANSVVILDEIQTLPPQFLLPIVDVMRELTRNYKTSLVLSTATPPSLAKYFDRVDEMVPDPSELAAHPAARRVRAPEWRIRSVVPYAALAKEIIEADIEQALIVVHRRQDAKELFDRLPPNRRVHLSAQLCPAHRIACLDEITRRMDAGEPCLVVATQLIEAGVDLDMPVVYRALAGMDSLAQAAGRCDREGRRTIAAGEPAGRLIVFRAETDPPGPTLRKALAATETVYQRKQLSGESLDIFNPTHCSEFFDEFYAANELDRKHIQRERANLNFANVAVAFQMIEDGWSFPVVVPWPFIESRKGEGRIRGERFREEPNRESQRALQPYIVQIPKAAAQQLAAKGVIEIWEGSIGLPTDLFDKTFYHDELGLNIDESLLPNPALFVC